MSFVVTAVVSSVVATGYSIYSGERAASQQKKAQNEARVAAQNQANAADQAFNAANKKRPDINAMLGQNRQQAEGGGGSTMLTGPAGVDIGALNLGKNTLLGA